MHKTTHRTPRTPRTHQHPNPHVRAAMRAVVAWARVPRSLEPDVLHHALTTVDYTRVGDSDHFLDLDRKIPPKSQYHHRILKTRDRLHHDLFQRRYNIR